MFNNAKIILILKNITLEFTDMGN